MMAAAQLSASDGVQRVVAPEPAAGGPQPRSLRVLLVTEDLPVANLGGAGKHAVCLGNALLEAGHDVEMLGRARLEGNHGSNGFRGTLHCGIDLRGAGWQEFRFGAFLPGRREYVARRIWRAIQSVGADRFDVIHYHGHHSALGAIVPPGVRFVHTLHDQGSDCLTMTRFKQGERCVETSPEACAGCAARAPNPLQRALSALAARRLRQRSKEAFAQHEAIFVSHFLRDAFLSNTRCSSPIRGSVIHNFTDAVAIRSALQATQPGHDAGARKPVALVVGRIDEAKGLGALLDALPDEFLVRGRLRVVGDGPLRATLQLKHQPRGVEFLGVLPQSAVYAETLAADVCIVPSVWDEPCATTVLEALALGKPVLALQRGGTPELARYAAGSAQLMLYATMRELVQGLAEIASGSPVAKEVSELADVRRRLHEILAVYRRAGRSAQTRTAMHAVDG